MTTAQDRITIYGPTARRHLHFKTATGEALAISIPRTETAVIRRFQARMPCRSSRNPARTRQTRPKMKPKFFAALLLGASVFITAPVQAKFIGIAIYDPIVMLPICKNEIAEGRAGVCTGYVIAVSEGMRAYSAWVPHDALCIPAGVEYEDMVQVVVSWTELSLRRNPEGTRDFRTLTEAALRSTWSCKQ
jgi:hypothetical protein